MVFIYYLIIFLIFILIFVLRKHKNFLVTIMLSAFTAYIVINPNLCINAAIEGSALFFYKVFPSLLPFLILSNLILSSGGVYIYSKVFGKFLCKPLKLPYECSFVLIVSMLSGYPLGAKYACDIYRKGLIDHDTCSRLLNIASNPSPIFVIGVVGTSLLKNTLCGYMLLFSCYVSCFITGLISNKKNICKTFYADKSSVKADNNSVSAIKNSIDSAIQICLSIGGFVIFFYVINALVQSSDIYKVIIKSISSFFNIDYHMLSGSMLGMIEMTNGCSLICSSSANIMLKCSGAAFLLSFSGLSIISQVYSFTSKYDFSLKKYVKYKFLQGIICSIIMRILFSVPVLNNLFIKETLSSCNSSAVSSAFNSSSVISVFVFEIIIFIILLLKTVIHKKYN